jgi:hypothetical protein
MVMGYPGHEGGKHHKDSPSQRPTEAVPIQSPEIPKMPEMPKAPEESPEKGTSMFEDLIGSNWKSLIGFAVTFGSQILARTFVEGTPVFPTDLQGWLALFGGSLLAAGLIWVKSNDYTVGQLQKKLDDKAAAKK